MLMSINKHHNSGLGMKNDSGADVMGLGHTTTNEMITFTYLVNSIPLCKLTDAKILIN